MNLQTLLFIFALAAFIAFRERAKMRQRAADAEPQYYDAAELTDAIRALYALTEQLENADRMLADLEACNPRELLRSFRAQWCGLDGKNRSIDLLADGANGATAGLKAAAQDQRDQINAEIIDTVRAMCAALDDGSAPALHLDAVGETVDETTAPAFLGE